MSGRFASRGHEPALRAVQRWVTAAVAPHAILLTGPPSVGKTTLAADLAAGLLCLAADARDRPCRECLACRKVAHGTHPDVHRLAPEGAGGQIRIAAVRTLGAELALLPVEGRQRLAVIEAAQRLNEDAQNALLKTLEEPPAGTTIVLCADDEDPILPTVRSRCVRLPMPALPARSIAALLVERGVADPVRAARIGRLADGRPGLATFIAAHPEMELAMGRVARRLIDLTRADRRTRLGAAADLLADGALLADLERGSAAPAEPDNGSSGAAVPAPAMRRRAMGALLVIWRAVARDLAVAGRGNRSQVHLADLAQELEEAAAGLPVRATDRFLSRIERAGALVESNANPELALDVLLLAWPRTPA